jgi:hypothetical protein
MLHLPEDIGQRIAQAAKLAVALHLDAQDSEKRNSSGAPQSAEPIQAWPWMASRSRRQLKAQNLRLSSRHGYASRKARTSSSPFPIKPPWQKGEAA